MEDCISTTEMPELLLIKLYQVALALLISSALCRPGSMHPTGPMLENKSNAGPIPEIFSEALA